MEKNEIKILETQALSLPEQAKQIQIVDDNSLHKGNEFIHVCRQLRKKIAVTMDPIIKRAHGVHQEALAQKRKLEGPLKQAEEIVGPRIASYKRKIEEEIRAQEEEKERKLAEEKKKKEEALEKAAALEKAGDKEKADEEFEKAEKIEEEEALLAEEPKFKRKAPDTPGTSIRKIWKWRLKNLKEVPIEYLKLDEVKIGDAVRTAKGEIEIPGIEIYADDRLSIRSQ